MKIHVLPGDALREKFSAANLAGEIIVCRECLIDGDLAAENLREFWQIRADFIEKQYGENEASYQEKIVSEFEKMLNLPNDSEVNLWFEHELFCQVNLWFCLSLLHDKAEKVGVYRVAPAGENESDVWCGFSVLNAEDLQKCFAERIKLGADDIAFGAELWRAYQASDFAKLTELARAGTPAFPHLTEVANAAAEKDFCPQNILREILETGATDFKRDVFPEFSRRAGVYGFGDTQIEKIMREI